MRWAVFGGIAAMAGCSLLVDTGDLAGGPLTTPLEAGAPALDGGARPADADAPDAPAGACPPDAIVCEDFETTTLADPGKWQLHRDDQGELDFPSDLVHGGQRAFRAVSKAHPETTDNEAELRLPVSPTKKAGTTIYWRAYVYLPGPFFHDTTISKWRTPAETTDDINLKIDANGHFIIDADNAKEGPELKASAPIEYGKWHCVDWRATLGTPGHERLLVDGVQLIDADETNVTSDGYSVFGLGFVSSPADHDLAVVFDDLIISETLVGCP